MRQVRCTIKEQREVLLFNMALWLQTLKWSASFGSVYPTWGHVLPRRLIADDSAMQKCKETAIFSLTVYQIWKATSNVEFSLVTKGFSDLHNSWFLPMTNSPFFCPFTKVSYPLASQTLSSVCFQRPRQKVGSPSRWGKILFQNGMRLGLVS